MRMFVSPLMCVLLLGGCWSDDDPVFGQTACNNNNSCDADESCQSCPNDCPCCTAIRVVYSANVANPEAALFKSDNKSATIKPNGVLTLSLGGKVVEGQGADLMLVGKMVSARGTGRVYVLDTKQDNTRSWVMLGSFKSLYDLNLTTLYETEFREIQIETDKEGQLELDAIRAANCGK